MIWNLGSVSAVAQNRMSRHRNWGQNNLLGTYIGYLRPLKTCETDIYNFSFYPISLKCFLFLLCTLINLLRMTSYFILRGNYSIRFFWQLIWNMGFRVWQKIKKIGLFFSSSQLDLFCCIFLANITIKPLFLAKNVNFFVAQYIHSTFFLLHFGTLTINTFIFAFTVYYSYINFVL